LAVVVQEQALLEEEKAKQQQMAKDQILRYSSTDIART
jgi:hypothetical protein